jgi:hypothetical protein
MLAYKFKKKPEDFFFIAVRFQGVVINRNEMGSSSPEVVYLGLLRVPCIQVWPILGEA